MFMLTIRFVTAYCSGGYDKHENRLLFPVPSKWSKSQQCGEELSGPTAEIGRPTTPPAFLLTLMSLWHGVVLRNAMRPECAATSRRIAIVPTRRNPRPSNRRRKVLRNWGAKVSGQHGRAIRDAATLKGIVNPDARSGGSEQMYGIEVVALNKGVVDNNRVACPVRIPTPTGPSCPAANQKRADGDAGAEKERGSMWGKIPLRI
jgi:hypothetical protein